MIVTAPHKPTEFETNREACRHFSETIDSIIDWRGRPTAEVAALNPASQPRRLNEWRIVNHDTGAWRSLSGDAGSGPDLVSLIAHLADVERPVAAELLASIVLRGKINRRAA